MAQAIGDDPDFGPSTFKFDEDDTLYHQVSLDSFNLKEYVDCQHQEPRVTIPPKSTPPLQLHLAIFDWDISSFSEYDSPVVPQIFKLLDCPMVWNLKMTFSLVKGAKDPNKIGSQNMHIHLVRKSSACDILVIFQITVSNTSGKVHGVFTGKVSFAGEGNEQLLFTTQRPTRPSQMKKSLKKGYFNLADDCLNIRGKMAIKGCCKMQPRPEEAQCLNTCRIERERSGSN